MRRLFFHLLALGLSFLRAAHSIQLLEGVLSKAGLGVGRSGWGALGLLPAPVAEAAPEPSARDLTHDQVVMDWELFNPLLGYYRRMLADLQGRLARRGVELSVVLVPSHDRNPLTARAQRRVHNQLKRFCRERGVPYHSLVPVLQGCEPCFLPGDGHFSPEGHRRAAAFVDRVVLGDSG